MSSETLGTIFLVITNIAILIILGKIYHELRKYLITPQSGEETGVEYMDMPYYDEDELVNKQREMNRLYDEAMRTRNIGVSPYSVDRIMSYDEIEQEEEEEESVEIIDEYDEINQEKRKKRRL